MKTLEEFVLNKKTILTEASKKEDDLTTKEVEKNVGKDAEKNGSNGTFDVDCYKDDDTMDDVNWDLISNNELLLIDKFDSNEPFMILGEAGWGKTSLIKKYAKKHKRHVITVYLDKCDVADLAGKSVPVEDKKTGGKELVLLPVWAQYMLEHKNEQFLLFFDEMNQAEPAVMNALMPIILETVIAGRKFNNFMVGCAGNYEFENENGVNELSVPLRQRLEPIINFSKDWVSAFRHLREVYQDKLPKEFMDKIEGLASVLFESPRVIDHKILKWVAEKVEGVKAGREAAKRTSTPEMLVARFKQLAIKDMNEKQKQQLEELAQYTSDLIHGRLEDTTSRKKRGGENIPEDIKTGLQSAIKDGFMDVNDEDSGRFKRYGVSKESAPSIFAETLNKEMYERLVKSYLVDFKEWKYQTDAEWKKAHPNWLDPMAD